MSLRNFRSLAALGLTLAGILAVAGGLLIAADTWIIVKQPSNGTCRVQKSTAQIIGTRIGGTYDSVKAANDALAAYKKNGTCAD